MKPSIIIKEIKEALGLSNSDILKIYKSENFEIDEDRLKEILKKDSATYEELGVFLDGLIRVLRGESPKAPNENDEILLDNNLIIKKLRIALNLKSIDIEMIFNLSDYDISKSKIKDLLRSPTHPKYKTCSDEVLKAFLEGLDEFYFDMPKLEIE